MAYHFYNWNKTDLYLDNERYPTLHTPTDLYDALDHVWCEATCAPRMRKDYANAHKTLGQCSITAFLVQDIFGGRVYGVPLGDGNYHCFNVVDNQAFDLTSEQFANEKLVYTLDYPQSRQQHFAKQEKYERYLYLKEKLQEYLNAKEGK